ncbi:conserved hypothetical protein [Leadbettera azotonutricia ZAS-9]|uniref:Carbohydrate-binding domain-containing protein n=1 Tax=Leadbettera azotonutricia (strain ATCC BAA-888 / DSM 13862 / ZAS-9) TaxID=545695 RepID=F5Y929_LEAAZ|nr:conserved hypothetical protein [Leadbettera azotonutricia ZAS-9]
MLAIILSILICSCGNPAGNNSGSNPNPISVDTLADLQAALADATKDPITLTANVNQTSTGSTLSVGGGSLKATEVAQVTYPAGTVFTKAAKTVNIGAGGLSFNLGAELALSSGLTLISAQDGRELRLIAGPTATTDDVIIHIDPFSDYEVVKGGTLLLTSDSYINAKGKGKADFYNQNQIVGALQGDWASSGYDTTFSTDTNTLIVEGATGGSMLYAAGDPASITIPAGKTLLIGANTTINLKGDRDNALGSIVLKGSSSAPYAKVTLAAASTSKVVTLNSTHIVPKSGPQTFDIGGNMVELTAGGKVVLTVILKGENSYFSQFTTTEADASLSAYGTSTVTIAADQPVTNH